MAEYRILYWKEIPAQVKVYAGRRPVSRPLPDRFQEEIDRIAMEEGLYGSDDYLEHWCWTDRMAHPGDAEKVLTEVIEELKRKFDHI